MKDFLKIDKLLKNANVSQLKAGKNLATVNIFMKQKLQKRKIKRAHAFKNYALSSNVEFWILLSQNLNSKILNLQLKRAKKCWMKWNGITFGFKIKKRITKDEKSRLYSKKLLFTTKKQLFTTKRLIMYSNCSIIQLWQKYKNFRRRTQIKLLIH